MLSKLSRTFAGAAAAFVATAGPARAAEGPTPVNAVGAVGAILSEGAWTHTVNLELPPAPAGMVPALALTADARVQDGPLGVGWRVDGFSRIERRSATGGVPWLTTSDTFWVDGARLYADLTTAATDDYRLEKDDNRVFVYSSDTNRWDVYRDGWQWRYGEWGTQGKWHGRCATEHRDEDRLHSCDTTPGLAPMKAGATTAWSLSRVQDPNANEIHVDYATAWTADTTPEVFGGDHLYVHVPDEVSYAGGYVAVGFEYDVRPDVRADARSGRLRKMPFRLAALQVWVDAQAGTPVQDARYEMVYLDDEVEWCPGEEAPGSTVDVEAASVLHRVVRVGTAGAERTVRCIETESASTTFAATDTAVFTGSPLGVGSSEDGAVNSFSPTLANFDGDPWSDVVVIGAVCGPDSLDEDMVDCTAAHSAWRWQRDAGPTPTGQDAALVAALEAAMSDTFFECDGRWSLVDVNRDGATDVLLAHGEACTLEEATMDPATAEPTNVQGVLYGVPGGVPGPVVDADFLLTAEEMADARFADIDGDGFVDLILRDLAAGLTTWVPNLGEAPWFDLADATVLDIPLEDSTSSAGGELADLQATCLAGTDLEPWPHSAAAVPVGFGFDDAYDYTSAQASWGDYNGDGIADVAYAFSACWEIDGSFVTPAPLMDVSHVFYGDGEGGFHEASAGAGPIGFDVQEGGSFDPHADFLFPYWLHGLADLDRSGRPDLIYSNAMGLEPLSAAMEVGLPLAFGFDGPFPDCPHAVCESSTLPVDYLSMSDGTAYTNAIDDWDADGYPDVVHLQLAAADSVAVSWFENERAVSRHRVKRIHEAWGGVTEVAWTSSVLSGENGELPYVVEVVESVDGENGLTRFGFEGGYTHDGRFMGFTEAWVQYEAGRTASVKFGQSPPVAGEVVSRTEYRADGTIETYALNSYFEGAAAQWALDTRPPYFNPLRRRCEFQLGPGYPSGASFAQSVDEEDLAEQCLEWDGSPTFWGDQWAAALGWDRNPTAPSAVFVRDAVWSPDNEVDLAFEGETGPKGAWPLAAWPLPERATYPPLDGAAPAGFVEPTTPELPYAIGPTTTEMDMYVVGFEYDADQRVVDRHDWRDASTTADDVHQVYTRATYDTAFHGEQLLSTVTTDAAGSVLHTVLRSNFVAFDVPEKVIETGVGGSGSRSWEYAWASGEVVSAKDPDGGLTTWVRNDCGQATLRRDPEGREERRTYTSGCREDRWEWEGAVRTRTYDELGRVETETTDARSGGAQSVPVVDTWYRDDQIDVVDVRGTWTEPRAAVVRGGRLRLLYLDPWGRETLEVLCDVGVGTACEPGTEVSRFRGWAADGSPRVETRPFAAGEVPAATFTFRDVMGRTEQRVDPAPIEVPTSAYVGWVTTTYSYAPGEVEAEDPLGKVCVTQADTLGSERWCEGQFRGATTLDELGNVLLEEDGDGVVTRFTYDDFHRLESRALTTSVQLHDGSFATPTWEVAWTPGGKLATMTDPAGGVRGWEHDDAGRPKKAWYDPPTEPLRDVTTWTWYDHTGVPGSRRVVSVDVDGNVSTSYLDGLDRTWVASHPDGTTEAWLWDATGDLASHTDRDGLKTQYSHLATGEVSSETDFGTGATRTYAYNGAGDLVEAVDRDGVVTEHRWTWDGRPARTSRGGWTLSSWEYRSDGRVVEAWEGGVDTLYSYDALGRRSLACVGAEAGTCGLNKAWTYTGADRLETETVTRPGETGLVTTWTTNDLGWTTRVEHPDTSFEEWGYDAMGRVRWHDDESNIRSSWAWDDWGRPATEQLPGQGMRTFSYTFGTLGSPEIHQVTEPDLGVWTTSYDFAGRAVAEEYPDGTGVERDYVGTQLTQVRHMDAGWNALAVEALEYDALGRVASRWGPVDATEYATKGGTWSRPDDYVFEYAWSDEGRLASVEGPNDLTEYTWGTDGLLSSEAIAGVTTHTYVYDTDWPRVSEITTGDGVSTRRVTRTWERGLWLAKEVAEEGGYSLSKEFGDWDAYGTPRVADSSYGPNGSLATQVQYDLSTDDRGRLTAVDVGIGGASFGQVGYGWEDNGAISWVHTTWAGNLEYVRDPSDGVLLRVEEGTSGQVLAAFPPAYRDGLGRALRVDLAAGGRIESAYDRNGRVTQWNVESRLGAYEDRSYEYDDRGRVWREFVSRPSGIQEDRYAYEEPGWLASETRDVYGVFAPTESIAYDYDAAGNRERRTVNGVAEPLHSYAWGNQLTAVDGGSAIAWDAFGGTTQDHRGYTFGRYPDGSELEVADPTASVVQTVTRDAYGRPVSVDDGVSTAPYTTVWGNPGGDWPMAGEDEDGNPVLWVAAEGILVGQIRAGVPVEAASGPDGSLLMHDATFLAMPGAWGENAGAHPLGPGATERYVYAGLQSLPGTPFALARQRAYDPTVGRFVSADPIGLAGGDHRFAYANGDPLGYVDPEGLMATGSCAPYSIGCKSPSDPLPNGPVMMPIPVKDDGENSGDGRSTFLSNVKKYLERCHMTDSGLVCGVTPGTADVAAEKVAKKTTSAKTLEDHLAELTKNGGISAMLPEDAETIIDSIDSEPIYPMGSPQGDVEKTGLSDVVLAIGEGAITEFAANNAETLFDPLDTFDPSFSGAAEQFRVEKRILFGRDDLAAYRHLGAVFGALGNIVQGSGEVWVAKVGMRLGVRVGAGGTLVTAGASSAVVAGSVAVGGHGTLVNTKGLEGIFVNASKAVEGLWSGGASRGAPVVHAGKQGKHIPGHPNYTEGRSILRGDPAKLAEKAGSGTPVNNVPRGQAGFKERVNFGEEIGDFVQDGVATPTTNGIIIYAGDGSIHIVPAAP